MFNLLNKMSLRTKLSFSVVLTAALVAGAIYYHGHKVMTQILFEDAERYARELIRDHMHRVEAQLKNVADNPGVLLAGLEENSTDLATVIQQLPAVVKDHKHLFGAAFAFEPYAFDKAIKDYAPYFYNRGRQVAKTDLAETEPDFRFTEWYKTAKEAGRSVWSDPYYDEGNSGRLMTTYSTPVYQADNSLLGVLTADITLSWISRLLDSLDMDYSGYAFIVSKNDKVLSHPYSYLRMKERTGIDDPIFKDVNAHWQQAKQHAVPIEFDPIINGPARMIVQVMPVQGWHFAVVLSEDELLAQLGRVNSLFIQWTVIGLILFIVVIKLVSYRLFSPLRQLAVVAQHLGQGDFDYPIDAAKSKDEIGAMTSAFIRLQEDLKVYVEKVTRQESAKKALEQELSIAQEIQFSMVPQVFPLSHVSDSIDIAAKLLPAKGVGGDLYDAFWVSDNKLFFTLGDVSGKGIPAALFMTKAITTLRGLARAVHDPATLLSNTNDELTINNRRFMFVTLLCGIIDISTGEVTLANAGHLPPLWLEEKNRCQLKRLQPECALAITAGTRYVNNTIQLQPGEKLVLYSDGVTEAFNKNEEAFGEERLLNSAASCSENDASSIVETLFGSVQMFVDNYEQSDDIAVMVIHWLGPRVD